MGALAAGAVVLVPFPFSDLSRTKLRPAIVLAAAGRGDWVLCQVTSKSYGDPNALALDDAAFASGSLRVSSYARPGKLFTASEQLIVAEVGQLTLEARSRISMLWSRCSAPRAREGQAALRAEMRKGGREPPRVFSPQDPESDLVACWSRTTSKIPKVSIAGAPLQRPQRLIPGTSGHTTTG